MRPRVHLVHQTPGRVRLRIPEKRKDLPYFLGLYENLRQIPDIADVVINPVTGSVLLHFPPESAGPVFGSLYGIGLLSLDEEEQTKPGALRRMERFFSGHRSGATDVRTVLLVFIIALAIRQVRRGMLVVPALSVIWYAYDIFASHRKESALAQTATGTPPARPDA